MTKVRTFKTAAPILAENGYEPVPIEPGTKKVTVPGWTKGGLADRA